MNQRFNAIAIAVATACCNAQAVQTFDYTYSGTQVQFWNCPGRPNGDCGFGNGGNELIVPWNGTVELTTPDGDGVFTSESLTIVMDGVALFLQQVDPRPPVVATVLDGVATLNGLAHQGFPNPTVSFDTDGTFISNFSAMSPAPGLSVSFSNGVLTQVPEPSTWAMLLGGLAAIGPLAPRRRSQVSGQRVRG